MAESNSTTIRAVAWSELFPWLSIVRAFRLAIAVRALILGAVGILLTATVWGVIGGVFGTDEKATQWLKPFAECPWLTLTDELCARSAVASNRSGRDCARNRRIEPGHRRPGLS